MTHDPRVERWTRTKAEARSKRGVVTAQHFAAAEAGAAVLDAGGNAVDAAVTAAFTLQTAEPWMSGLGACGYLLVAQPGRAVETIEFTGRLPEIIDMGVYAPDPSGARFFNGNAISQGQSNIRGYSSVAIPGCVRGLAEALRRFGTISFKEALIPTRRRAEAGMPVEWHSSLAIALAQEAIRRDPGMSAIFLPSGAIPQPGETLAMPTLAATLARLSDYGPEELYEGQIASDLVADLQENGNGITAGDMAAYRPLTYSAEESCFGAYHLHTAGETSAGARLHATMAEFMKLHGDGPVSPAFFSAMAQALSSGYRDAVKPATPADRDTEGSTTQVNAVDEAGRFVSITFTLFARFGAGVLSPRTGIVLNNGMAWYDPRPGLKTSMIPNAYAHSNMCPAIVTRDGVPVLAVGASGANMIVPAIAQLIALHLCAGLGVGEAAHRPRFHRGPDGKILANVDMTPDEISALEALGPVARAQAAVMPRPFGSPSMIGRDGHVFVGVPDISYPGADAIACAEDPSG